MAEDKHSQQAWELFKLLVAEKQEVLLAFHRGSGQSWHIDPDSFDKLRETLDDLADLSDYAAHRFWENRK